MVPTTDRRRTKDGRSSIGQRVLGIVAILLAVVVGCLIINEILGLILVSPPPSFNAAEIGWRAGPPLVGLLLLVGVLWWRRRLRLLHGTESARPNMARVGTLRVALRAVVVAFLGVVAGLLIGFLIFDELIAHLVPFDATAAGPWAVVIGLGPWFMLVAGGVVAVVVDRHRYRERHRRGERA